MHNFIVIETQVISKTKGQCSDTPIEYKHFVRGIASSLKASVALAFNLVDHGFDARLIRIEKVPNDAILLDNPFDSFFASKGAVAMYNCDGTINRIIVGKKLKYAYEMA